MLGGKISFLRGERFGLGDSPIVEFPAKRSAFEANEMHFSVFS
jgi:hypothetical protein